MPTPRVQILAMLTGALLSLPLCAQATEQAPDSASTPSGQLIGVKSSTHPAWFKESFLDIDEDIEEAARDGKHLILFMEMNGCPYCAKMAEENFKEAPYSDFIQEKFDVIALNVFGDREVALDAETAMTEKELAGHLGVRNTPTLIFLNANGEPVVRVNGYRNVADFKQVLDYVATKAYETQTLAQFIAAASTDAYSFRPHPRIQNLVDLSRVTDKPLAILFEDAGCVACAALHDGHLSDPEVDAALSHFVLVRLDSRSETPIKAPDGTQTTPKRLAEELGIDYRPTLVLYDQGKEIARVESMLYRYHFIGFLEYVGQRHYQKYPNDPFDYINAKTAERIAAGQDVRVSDD